ncbi:hypothetical protein Hamer_G017326 [Homarus americanus]|uniref:Uncharacterized protein n=2 Tax=Homarus americanus TaxID=6706 RepID=A0A8J5JVC7_HOMAM|nr:hypothetical protein Hamer_G017326 [Homarus americanus]
MQRLLLVCVLPALTLASSLYEYWEAFPEDEGYGPGCVDGKLVYPDIPDDIKANCLGENPPEPLIITNDADCSSYIRCHNGDASPIICCQKEFL